MSKLNEVFNIPAIIENNPISTTITTSKNEIVEAETNDFVIPTEIKQTALNNLRRISDLGMKVLEEAVGDLIEPNEDSEYSELSLNERKITAVSSLISALNNVQGKILGDGKGNNIRINKTNNTQQNIVNNENKKTTKEILEEIKGD